MEHRRPRTWLLLQTAQRASSSCRPSGTRSTWRWPRAWGFGCVTVGSTGAGASYLIEDRVNGMCCEPTDPRSLADALLRAHTLSDRDRREMGERARATVAHANWILTASAHASMAALAGVQRQRRAGSLPEPLASRVPRAIVGSQRGRRASGQRHRDPRPGWAPEDANRKEDSGRREMSGEAISGENRARHSGQERGQFSAATAGVRPEPDESVRRDSAVRRREH